MSIFRAYDIRGVYGKDLTEEIMERIGMAAGTYASGNFTVGRDIREHSVRLQDALVSGLKRTGSNAQLIGACPASLCVFANWKLHNDTSAYVTASHLPAEWNGVKFFHKDGVGFFEEENKKLEEIHYSQKFKKGEGSAKEVSGVEDQYTSFIAERIRPEKTKVVADFGNGAACLIVPKIMAELGIDAKFLFDWPDARFPNRDPEPKPEALSALCKKVVEEKAELGVAYDSDGDRAVFVDDMGKVLMTEQAAVLLIRDIMKENKGPVVANVECSDLIEEEVSKHGETVFRIPVGHTFLVQETKKRNAVLGVESSGHICVPKFYMFDDAIINSMYLTDIISRMSQKLSEFIKELPPEHFHRIEIECSDEAKFKVMKKINEKALKSFENVSTIDGVKVSFPKGWALIRASNTSPRIRVSVEAKSEKTMKELETEMTKFVNDIISSFSLDQGDSAFD
jgi:phosphomannomutase